MNDLPNDKSQKLCCLCASWIAEDCLDDFEGEPCHKICKAEGVGKAYKPRPVTPSDTPRTDKAASLIQYAVVGEQYAVVTADYARQLERELNALKSATAQSEKIYTKEDAEALCEIAVAAARTRDGCPCLVIGACSHACSCVHPYMSGGCQRCAKYGSDEQREAAARYIADALARYVGGKA